jgi:ornithine cyclodeaminase
MRFFDAKAITAALPMGELLDAVEAAYRDVAAGRDRSPVRSRVPLPHGDLLLMPGVREGGAGSSVKLVTVMPDNARRGLPTIQALVVLLDAESGEPLAVLEGSTLTAMRTGAASGVSARLMARSDASVLAILGVGAQAAWQVRAVAAARRLGELRVFAPTPAHRAAFAASMAAELGTGVLVRDCESAEEAIRGADMICTATTSSQPVFDAAWVSPGAHVSGIGAYRLDMRELPAELFARAALVAVDSRAAALEEAGDLVAALDAGLLARDGYREIGELAPGWAAGRDPAAITVFKSVGLAIQDLAAAEVAARRLLAG